MRYLYIFILVVSIYTSRAQCSVTFSIITPPTCSTCCDAFAQANYPCGLTFSWSGPFGYTSSSQVAGNLCAGYNYTVTIGASPLCCGPNTVTASVFIPITMPTQIEEQIELKNLTISPNPGNGKINILTSNSLSDIEMKIYDITGKLVLLYELKNTKKEIETDLNNGVYFVKLIDKKTEQQTTRKIIIQK